MNKTTTTTTTTTTGTTNNKENFLPKLTFPGKTTYTYNKSECNFICNELLQRSKTQQIVLGFDIEWKVTYTTGDYRQTSVLQLCEGSMQQKQQQQQQQPQQQQQQQQQQQRCNVF